MNRVPATVLWASLGGATWLVINAGFAAEPDKSDGNEPTKAATQQRLEAAQRRLETAAQEVADLSMSLSEEEVAGAPPPRIRGSKRAVLGIAIDKDQDDERDEGVELVSVSPGGAAAEAGLKSGDVLLALNNKSLKRDDEGAPRIKLLAVMRSVKPGDKVAVKYDRDGKIKTVDVAVKAIAITNFAYSPPFPPGRPPHVELPPLAFRMGGGLLGNAELVTLTPKLGQYFGTEKGLLVVRAPLDEEIELEDGDVILEIDGRTPNSTSHAVRILSSYQSGEKLMLTVMRKKRRTNIEVVVPENVPAARIERQLERSLRSLPSLPQSRRGIHFVPAPVPSTALAPVPHVESIPAPMALTPVPPLAPLAPMPPSPPAIEISPLPEDGVQVY